MFSTAGAPPTPSQLWRRYLAWPATNLVLLGGTMAVAGFAITILALAFGVPTGDLSIVDVFLGAAITPVVLLSGPGVVIALVLVALIGWGSRHGRGRWFAIAAATLAGFTWLGILFSPQLLDGYLPDPASFLLVVPWAAYGFTARLARRVSE